MSDTTPSVSGVRGVLTEALADHYPVFDADGHISGTVPGRGSWECYCGLVYGISKDEVVEHVAHVLLGLGGVAVTQLPPTHVRSADRDQWAHGVSLWKDGRDKWEQITCTPYTLRPMSAYRARIIAADLLAAASLAESRAVAEHQEPT